MKVLVIERIVKEGIEILKNEGIEVDERFGFLYEEICNIIGEYDVLIVRSVIKVNEEMIKCGKNLKVIVRVGVGIDNVDVEAVIKQGIIVVNVLDGNIMAAVEFIIGFIFSIFRYILQVYMFCKQGDFRRNKFKGVEFYEKIVGIIGFGKIGVFVVE